MQFKRIYVEITNECNLNCHFCAQCTRTIEHMSPDRFDHICQSIRPFSDYIYLHVRGEPLLHPQFNEICQIAHSYAFQIQVVTNGTLLQQNLDALCRYSSIRQVSISMQSIQTTTLLDEEIFRNQLVDDIFKLNTCGKIVQLRLWTYSNETLTDGLKTFFKKLELEDIESIWKNGRRFQIADKIYLSLDEPFVWPSSSMQERKTHGTCYGTRTMIGILVDGTVVPCCLDSDGHIPLGNIFTEDLSSIIKSSRFKSMVDNFNHYKIIEPFCQSCSYRTRFD